MLTRVLRPHPEPERLKGKIPFHSLPEADSIIMLPLFSFLEPLFFILRAPPFVLWMRKLRFTDINDLFEVTQLISLGARTETQVTLISKPLG